MSHFENKSDEMFDDLKQEFTAIATKTKQEMIASGANDQELTEEQWEKKKEQSKKRIHMELTRKNIVIPLVPRMLVKTFNKIKTGMDFIHLMSVMAHDPLAFNNPEEFDLNRDARALGRAYNSIWGFVQRHILYDKTVNRMCGGQATIEETSYRLQDLCIPFEQNQPIAIQVVDYYDNGDKNRFFTTFIQAGAIKLEIDPRVLASTYPDLQKVLVRRYSELNLREG